MISTTSVLFTILALTMARSFRKRVSSQKAPAWASLSISSSFSRTARASGSIRYAIPTMVFPASFSGTVTSSVFRFTRTPDSSSIRSLTMYQE